ncbi:MAG: hypothetical protein LBM26_03490, partial [Methanobrevibacter sp.]|nr:hypothetical protein [Methanobrevibacter sp.]
MFVFVIGIVMASVSAVDASSSVSKPKKLTQSQIMSASKTVKTYTEKYKKLPSYVSINGYKYSMAEYSYVSSVAIKYKYKNSKASVTVKYGIKNPSKPSGTTVSGKLTKYRYTVAATNAYKYMQKNNKASNYVSTSIGKMQFQTFVYGNSKVLAWAKSHSGKLPSTLTMKIAKTHSINKYLPTAAPNTPSTKSFTLNQIFEASKRVKEYVEKKDAIPTTVTISGKKYNIQDFLYLVSKAIVTKYNGKNSNIKLISTKVPTKPSGNN